MYRLNGVRQPESTRRKKMYKDTPFIIPDRDLSGSFMVFPILEWKGEDVKEYLKSKNVEIHKQYEEFGVSGCAYCPYYTEDIYHRILSVFPDIYDDIIKVEEEVGKPAVQRNVFLKDLKQNFIDNKEEIIKGFGNIKEKK
jgi:3'-phosphoadenosine 5'-phosphosulfate sulfotransferase (PAPS reductase)/FAD synthetase